MMQTLSLDDIKVTTKSWLVAQFCSNITVCISLCKHVLPVADLGEGPEVGVGGGGCPPTIILGKKRRAYVNVLPVVDLGEGLSIPLFWVK